MVTREHTVQDFYGPDTVFATKFNDSPCRVIIESSSGNGAECTATLLLKAQNASGKEVDAFRLEVQFHANQVEEVSTIRYVRLENLGDGRSEERSYSGDAYEIGELVGLFAGIIDTFWGSDTVPEAMLGTWVRKGADSGRDFDTTTILTAVKIETKYSDGRTMTWAINKITAETNFKADTKAEYPFGWNIRYTVTESSHPNFAVGKNYNTDYFFNAVKNKFDQFGDVGEIFVKQ
jgi:hypothetical protein